MSDCVTLEEVLAAAHARYASLVPETSGYLTLAVSDATSRLPLRFDDGAVLLTTEGTVTVRSRGEPVAPAEAARHLRDLLARLLAASAGSMPNLTAAARPRGESERDPDAVARELEAALIPVNRHAARRALARLARETLRARDAGRLRRARVEVQARPPAPKAKVEPTQPAGAEAAAVAPPRAEVAAVAPRVEVAAAPPRAEVAAAPPRAEVVAAPPRAEVAAVAPRAEVAAAPAPAAVELPLDAGQVAPAAVELPLDPGQVAAEDTGLTIPAPVVIDDAVAPAAVEPPPQAAPAHARTPHESEHAESSPEPTPTIVQAVVEVEVETTAAPAEAPPIPELIEPARTVAPVAPIAPVAPLAAAVLDATAAVDPAEARAVPASAEEDAVPRDTAANDGAFTSPEGIEALLAALSPGPTGVVPRVHEPTPTVATPVWTETADAAGVVDPGLAEAPAEATEDAPASATEDAPAGTASVPAAAVEASHAPAVATVDLPPAEESAPQLTPAYGERPAVHREELASVPSCPRMSVASSEETPAARHTLPWPVLAQRDARDPAAPAPAVPPAPPAASAAATNAAAIAHTGAPSADAAPAGADAAPAEEPCPPGLDPIDAIVWSASRRAKSAPPPADGDGAHASRLDELLAGFVARSERSTQRRAARSMKVLAGLDPTLTPPPVAVLPAHAALALQGVRSPVATSATGAASSPAPSDDAAPGAAPNERRPPAPLWTPRRKGLSLWLALVALALLCAGLVGTLRPELFTSLTQPLAHGALHAAPRAEAKPSLPHD